MSKADLQLLLTHFRGDASLLEVLLKSQFQEVWELGPSSIVFQVNKTKQNKKLQSNPLS